MKDRWTQIVERARNAPQAEVEDMPFGFAEAVMCRLARAKRPTAVDAWVPLLRPAFGLAFATPFLCVLLQTRTETTSAENLPENFLVQTENLIQMAVLE